MGGTLCGQSDPPLNALGREQADSLAQSFRGSSVRRVYASNLQRAVQTAQPIAELLGLPLTLRTELGEIGFGEWEGKRWSQIRAENPEIAAIESSPERVAPGGESFGRFRERVTRVLNEILTESGGQPAAIITHLGVIRFLLSELVGAKELWEPERRIEYCAVFQLQLPGS